MPLIQLESIIAAPAEICFDLARDIDFHTRSTGRSNEKAIGGVTSGLIGPGEEVTWEATHFGIRQRLTSRITAYDRPYYFRDSQVRGAFRCFDHDHFFYPLDHATTRAVERFDYQAPCGALGSLADLLFLKRYMYSFLAERHRLIKAAAESRCRGSAGRL